MLKVMFFKAQAAPPFVAEGGDGADRKGFTAFFEARRVYHSEYNSARVVRRELLRKARKFAGRRRVYGLRFHTINYEHWDKRL